LHAYNKAVNLELSLASISTFLSAKYFSSSRYPKLAEIITFVYPFLATNYAEIPKYSTNNRTLIIILTIIQFCLHALFIIASRMMQDIIAIIIEQVQFKPLIF